MLNPGDIHKYCNGLDLRGKTTDSGIPNSDMLQAQW